MQRKNVSTVWCARVFERAILATIFGFLFSTSLYAQSETETVDFNIPSLALPQALNEFARQASVELVFAERGFDSVRTTAVVGAFQKERALELLLAGTGLRVGYGSGDSVIVQRADASASSEVTTSLAVGDSNSGMVLLAQAAVGASQDSDDLEGAGYQSGRATEKSNSTEKPPLLEEVLVTGSRIRGAQSASPVVTITRQEIDQAGFATVEEVVENLPQNFGAGATLDATQADNKLQAVGGSVGDFSGGTSVNLRGLGASSTLVLLNGRRMSPSGAFASFTNISSIPVTAIERVEVMTDGASAIYGSDAIGGVINFILRDDYEGAETRLRYGSDRGGDTSNVQFAQTFGSSWDSGNVLFTYEYYDSEALASSDREFTASNDLSPFGGTDRRQPGGNPANIRIDPFGANEYYAIPTGQDGTSLTAADFDLSTPRHLYNARKFDDVTPALERHSGFFQLRQTVGAVELFGAARFSSEKNTTRFAQPALNVTVIGDDPATPGVVEGNPWFVDPTGTGLTTVDIAGYTLEDDFGPNIRFGEIKSYGATLGARFEFNDNWRGDFTVNWSEEEGMLSFGNEIDLAALSAAVNLSDPALAFNPFGDGSNTNSAVIESLVNRRELDFVDKNELQSVSFDVNGDVFEISGGTVKVATGIDFREESVSTVKESTTPKIASDLSRDVLAVYAEVFLPLVSDSNSRTGLQRFEVSLAARYEDYSDFGNSTNPKLGILWSPTRSLTFRGTIGSSYRAPSLTDLNDTASSDWIYFPDFFSLGQAFLLQQGRNRDLQPEEATTWTAGFQWNPERADGLSLDLTYFNVDFTDRIETPVVSAFAAINDPRFASIITPTPDDDQIAAIVNHPNYNPDFLAGFGLGSYPAADFGGPGGLPVGSIFDNRLTNLSQSVVTGVEMQLSYSMETDLGSFDFGLNGSYLFDFERKLIEADPLVDEVGTLGRPVDLRARGNVTWNRNNWTIAGYVNYIDGYTDNVSSPARAVDSWTTVDLTIAYNTGENRGFLSDTRLSLTTKNLFDEDPPFVDTFGGVGYDATNASPLGQFISLQITKDW